MEKSKIKVADVTVDVTQVNLYFHLRQATLLRAILNTQMEMIAYTENTKMKRDIDKVDHQFTHDNFREEFEKEYTAFNDYFSNIPSRK